MLAGTIESSFVSVLLLLRKGIVSASSAFDSTITLSKSQYL